MRNRKTLILVLLTLYSSCGVLIFYLKHTVLQEGIITLVLIIIMYFGEEGPFFLFLLLSFFKLFIELFGFIYFDKFLLRHLGI